MNQAIKVGKAQVKDILAATFSEYRGRKFKVEFTPTVTFYDTNWGGEPALLIIRTGSGLRPLLTADSTRRQVMSKTKWQKVQQRKPLGKWELVKVGEMTFEEAATLAYKALSSAIHELGEGEAFETRFGNPGNWHYVPSLLE